MGGALQRACSVALVGVAACARAAATSAEDAPPVAFSHQVHAGQSSIGCGVCHPYARHSPNAGLAPVSVCVGCHKFVAKDRPDIEKLLAAYAAGTRLAWTRMHREPDHVFFSHERHLAAGLLCRACHGDVAAMQLDHQVLPLDMGFCLDCHRERHAPTDCLTCHK